MNFWGFCRKVFFASLVFSFVVAFSSCRKKSEPERSDFKATGDFGEATENGEASATWEETLDYDETAVAEGSLVPLPSIDEIIAIEDEEIRIAAELELMENAVDDAAFAEEVAEALPDDFTAKNGLLESSQYEKEVLQTGIADGKRILIYAIGNKVTRKFFDDDYRLEKKEEWSIGSLTDSQIIREERFSYANDGALSEKTVDYELIQEKFYYGSGGLTQRSERFKKVDGKSYITERSRWKYDSENRIIEVNTRSFSYNSLDDTKRRDVFVKTFKYKYNPNAADGTEIPPDVTYYENDVLKSSEKHSDVPGTFTRQYFFDGNVSIKSWYSDFKKIREAIYLDDKVLRVNKIDDEKPAL